MIDAIQQKSIQRATEYLQKKKTEKLIKRLNRDCAKFDITSMVLLVCAIATIIYLVWRV